MIIKNSPYGKIEEFKIGEHHYQYVINPEWCLEQKEAEKKYRFQMFEEKVKAVG